MIEEDIKHFFITPAIETASWNTLDLVRMERRITDGRVNLRGNVCTRKEAKKQTTCCINNTQKFLLPLLKQKTQNISFQTVWAKRKNMLSISTYRLPTVQTATDFRNMTLIQASNARLRCLNFLLRRTFGALWKRSKRRTGNNRRGNKTAYAALLFMAEYAWATLLPAERHKQDTFGNSGRTEQNTARNGYRYRQTYTAFQIVWRLLKSGTKKKTLLWSDLCQEAKNSVLNEVSHFYR